MVLGPVEDVEDQLRQKSNSAVSGAVSSVQKGAIQILGNTGAIVVAVFVIGCAIGVPLAMMIVGAENINDCPVEKKIPIYLIVSGALGLFLFPLAFLCGIFQKCLSDESSLGGCLACCTSTLVTAASLFSFAWFIAGNVWVFSNYKPKYSHYGSDYCNEVTYKLAFWSIICTYVFSVLCCCCSCCFARKTTYDELN